MPRDARLLHRRHWLVAGLGAGLGAGLAACGSSPPVRLYVLPSAAPGAPDVADVPVTAANAEVWQLMQPVRVPEYLDREALLLPDGSAALQLSSGHRWAESLRDAVPRVLLQDLLTLRGEGRVWASPLPPGLVVTRQLRVELLAFEADAGQQAVRLQARWTVTDPRAVQAPRSHAARLRVPRSSADIDGLVAAHRLALWQLAQRIVADS